MSGPFGEMDQAASELPLRPPKPLADISTGEGERPYQTAPTRGQRISPNSYGARRDLMTGNVMNERVPLPEGHPRT